MDLAEAAATLARTHMRMHAGSSPAFGIWDSRARLVGPKAMDRDRKRVEPFVRDAFGLPEQPLPDGHVEGYVAQLVWYCLISEATQSLDGLRSLVRVEDLGFSVLEPGGDGLAVYAEGDGTLVFRLWEIKKHVAQRHVASTIARACDQLNERATSYLAKFTSTGRHLSGNLGALYAQLVDLWIDADVRAGAGVSVTVSASHAPRRRAFGTMRNRFPSLTTAQREGLIAAIADFPSFARMTRDWVWSGL